MAFRLDHQSLWLDEVMSLEIAQGSLEVMAGWFRALPEQHPFYYVPLKGWLALFGDSEVALRSLSGVFGAATVPLMFVLGRRLADVRVGLISAALLAISPFWVFYGQEGRMYTLLVLLVVLNTLAWLSARDHGGRLRTGLYWTTGLLGVYTHFFFGFVMMAQVAGDWLSRREGLASVVRRAFVLQGAVAVGYLPWAWLILTHFPEPHDWKGWQHILFGAPYTALRFAVGYGEFPGNMGWKDRVPELIRENVGILLAAALAHGVLLLGALRERTPSFRAGEGCMLLSWLLVPVVLPLAMSPITILSGERYFMVVLPFYLIALALGATGLLRGGRVQRGIGLGALSLVVLVSIVSLRSWYFDPEVGKEQWREVAARIGAGLDPEDQILVRPEHSRASLAYYLQEGEIGRLMEPGTEPEPRPGAGLWIAVRGPDEEPVPAFEPGSLCVLEEEVFPKGRGILLRRLGTCP